MGCLRYSQARYVRLFYSSTDAGVRQWTGIGAAI
jgi:hypothetical protein